MAEETVNLQLTWTDPRSGEPMQRICALPLSIGRDSSNTIMIASTSVSRRHAEIRWEGNKVVITDLGSSNGTFINGEQINSASITEGDEVWLGEIRVGIAFTTEQEARPKRPSRDHLFDALDKGHEKTISLKDIRSKQVLFADLSDKSAEPVTTSTPAIPHPSSDKLSGDELKTFITGKLQKNMAADISPDVEQMAASFRPKTGEVPAEVKKVAEEFPPTEKRPDLPAALKPPASPPLPAVEEPQGFFAKLLATLKGLFGG